MNIEPFGYFRALPFGWEDCGEKEEGAIPLYEQQTVDELLKEIEGLNKEIENLEGELDQRPV